MKESEGVSAAASWNSGRRYAGRKHVLMTATLITCEGAHKAHVRDISSQGAQVVASGPLKPSSDAMFRRGPIFVAAKIAWSDGNEAGVRFYRALSESDLASMFQPLALKTSLP